MQLQKKTIYIIKATIKDIILHIWFFLDFLLPDFLIISPFRAFIFSFFVKIGKKCRIKKNTYFNTPGKNLKIGDNCFINRNNTFDNNGEIRIGNNTTIGSNNHFITTQHYEKDKIPKDAFTSYVKKIYVGDNVWITTNCIILPGTIIEDNVIIGAGSVVRGRLKENSVYAGVPVKFLRKTSGIASKIR